MRGHLMEISKETEKELQDRINEACMNDSGHTKKLSSE